MSKGPNAKEALKALDRRVQYLGTRLDALKGEGGSSYDAQELKALRWAMSILRGQTNRYVVTTVGPQGDTVVELDLTMQEASAVRKVARDTYDCVPRVEIKRKSEY